MRINRKIKVLALLLVMIFLVPYQIAYGAGAADVPLNPELVVAVDGHGGFYVLAHEGLIRTDRGTIVRRDGRRVTGRDIRPWDYVIVTLSSADRAAVVEIVAAPAFTGVQIARGRIGRVEQGQSFQVQSMSLFDGQQWHFTPIERVFTIDTNTRFMVGGNPMDMNNFLSFMPEAGFDGAINAFNQVFNVVIDGGRAAWVTDAPYATQSIRGIIYHIEGDTLYLRDTHVRNQLSGAWTLTSNVSATSNVSILNNSVIIDRNQVVGINHLQVGQQVRVMTTTLPQTAPAMSVNGYIVMVER